MPARSVMPYHDAQQYDDQQCDDQRRDDQP